MRSDNSWVSDNHTTLNILLVDTTEEQTYVITSLTFVKNLAEHFNTCYNRLSVFTKTEELNFVTYLYDTSFDTTCCYSTTTCDREHVFNWHQEWLINVANWFLNPSVASIHQFHNLSFPFWNTVECTKGRATDEWSLIFELILSEEVTHFHFNEVKHFLIVNHITLVHEYNKAWHVYLTSEKDVLASLWHRTISCSNYDDSAIHLSSTSYHVLHIVGVSRTVNVCVVTLSCFILNVSSVDSDTALFLFWSVVNLVERLNLREASLCKNCSDSSCKSSLTVVNVTDCTDVYVGFGTFEFFFCHSV